MKTLSGLLLLSYLVCGGFSVLAAQESAGDLTPPPKVLVIQREFVKPGKQGSAHEKTEGAFVRAMMASKWPTRYLGMDSLSGPSRSLFFIGYDSFAAWEKDNIAMMKDPALSTAFDRASQADGELLSRYETGIFTYNEEYSLRAPVNIGQMKLMEITGFKIRVGHRQEWDSLVKMYKSAYEKAVPDAHWAMFETMYGADISYLMVTPMKSASEIDSEDAAQIAFHKGMSADDAKKLSELAAACIESSDSNLFLFNPKMSYPRDEWVKADPAFWKPRAITAKKGSSHAQ